MPLTAEDVKKLMPSLEAFLSMKAAEGLDSEGGAVPPGVAAEAAQEGETPEYEAAEKAAMQHMAGEGMEAEAEEGEEKKGPGLAVVIDMKPKGKPMGGKVPGCPDCADGTPHQHMGK